MNSDTLAKRLVEVRKRQGLSQEELAQRADVSYSGVSKLEQGKIKNPSIWTVLSLSKALNTSLDDLLMTELKTASITSHSAQKAIKLLVIDLHGVLVEGMDDLFSKMSQRYAVDPHRLEEVFWQFDDKVCTGKMSVETLNERMDSIFNINGFNFFEFYLEHFRLHKPISDLLQDAKNNGVKIALLSQIFPDAYSLLEKLGKVPSFTNFDAAALSYEIGETKPDETYYRYIEEKLKVDKDHILYVDDTEINIEHAVKHGWESMLYNQLNAEYCVESLRNKLGIF